MATGENDPTKTPRSSQSLLDGFVAADSRAVIQANVHIILSHGWFQRWILLCAIVSLVVLLMHGFAYRIIGRPIDHWCQPPEELRYLSPQEWRNMAVPVLPDGSFSQCTFYDPPLPIENEERREVPCERWDYDIKRPEDSIVSSWNLVCGRRWLYSISSSVYMLGPLIFMPIVGIASDRVGRWRTLMICGFGLLVATLSAGSSQSFPAFIVARCVISAMCSAVHLLLIILLYEVTGDDNRPLYILLATSVGSVLSEFILFILVVLQPRWFLAQAVIACVSAFLVVWCYSLCESPVWLLDTGNIRPAENIVIRAAATNGLNVTKARTTFRELKKMLEKQESASANTTTNMETKVNTGSFRRRAASVLTSWFGVNFAFYGIGYIHVTHSVYWPLFSYVLEVLLYFAAYKCISTRGQRAALTFTLIILCVCSAANTVSGEWRIDAKVPLARMLVVISSRVAMSVNIGYTAEVYPTIARSLGLCISYSVGRAGALLAAVISNRSYGEDRRTMNILMTVLTFTSLVAIQWLPEVFIKKQSTTEQTPLSDEQRKEALKASLAHGETEAKTTNAKKSRRHRKTEAGSKERGRVGVGLKTSHVSSVSASPVPSESP